MGRGWRQLDGVGHEDAYDGVEEVLGAPAISSFCSTYSRACGSSIIFLLPQQRACISWMLLEHSSRVQREYSLTGTVRQSSTNRFLMCYMWRPDWRELRPCNRLGRRCRNSW